MAVSPYLYFNGNCREAIEFYADVFGIENPHIMAFGDVPPAPSFRFPDEAKNLVIHARLDVLGSSIMFSDVFPGLPFTHGNNIGLALVTADADEVQRLYDRLKEGGKVTMELQETFWSKRYGMVRDKFGIEWKVSLDSGEAAT